MVMDIKDFLAKDESVLKEYKTRKNYFYATDRRIIWTHKGSFLDASYNHVNSIRMDRVSHKILLALGVLLFLGGIGFAAMGVIGGGEATIGLAVLFLILFFVLRGSIYRLSLSSGELIPVPKTKSSNAEAFIKEIRDRTR